MVKPRVTSQVDIYKLIDKSYDYLINNFHKFSQANKIKVALRIIEKHMDILAKEPDKQGDTYISNIINSFNTQEDSEQIKEIIEASLQRQ